MLAIHDVAPKAPVHLLVIPDGHVPSIAEVDALTVGELAELVDAGHALAPGTVEAVASAVEGSEPVGALFSDVIWRGPRTEHARAITPKTAGQKRYADAIRRHIITFGIGPAGTGKTY